MPTPIDGYLAEQPSAARRVLRAVRAALKKGVGGAEEVISYAIPALRKDGRVVVFFAAWKDHYAVYPVGELVRRELADAIAPHHHAKGTLRFSWTDPVPVALLSRIGELRALEVAAKADPKKPGAKKRPARKKRAGTPTKRAAATTARRRA